MNSPGQSATQMKVMMYGMPIMFFFILYNTPSGLLVYWIVSNVLSIGQQVVINDILKKRKAAKAAANPVHRLAAEQETDEKQEEVKFSYLYLRSNYMVHEFEGRSEKEAIDAAAEELRLERDGFDVEILESQTGAFLKRESPDSRAHP